MINPPLVSIVLPTYNGSRYIEQAIQSCLNQSFTNLELIIVDDASIDNTSNILLAYKNADKRVRTIHHKTNSKLPGALNSGFAQAKGLYLTWTSDDNCYRPNAIAEMLTFLESRPEVAVLYTDYTIIDEKGIPLKYITVSPMEDLVNYNCIGPCFLYRRTVHEKLGHYTQRFFLAEDYDFWLRASISFNLQPLHKDLYHYRQHDSSLSSLNKIGNVIAIEALKQTLPEMNWLKNASRATGYLRIALAEQNNNNTHVALKYMFKALYHSPRIFYLPTTLGLLINILFGRNIFLFVRRFYSILKKSIIS